MRRMRWLANPRSQQRLTYALVGLSAITGGAATAFRQALDAADDRWTVTFLLDLLAVALAVVSAIVAARASSILAAFPGGATRRAAALQAVGGMALFLGGCVLVPASPDISRSWGAAPLAALLYGGLALLLSGLGRLAVLAGGSYLAERIDRLSQEDV